jgi:hypothetical protein
MAVLIALTMGFRGITGAKHPSSTINFTGTILIQTIMIQIKES